jgi:hypothetical protein
MKVTLRKITGFLFLLWLTHALGYLIHEYAHAVVAWALGWKANPLALNYGGLNLNNILFQSDIDENVNYDPIFAAGQGVAAAMIAISGVLLGNSLGYLISRVGYYRYKTKGKKTAALFMFLFCIMNAGNFISYVPTRTFATHADMATVTRGLHISPWWIVLILGVPFCLAVIHFFSKILPGALRFFPEWRVDRILLVVLSSYMFFDFYGSAGLHHYGQTAHWISVVSVYVLFPLMIALFFLPKSKASATRQ